MIDLLKGLQIDAWYKVFVYLGAVGFIISLFIDVKGITNQELLIFSLGLFFIGVGEWKNHKWLSYIKPPNAYTGPSAFIQQEARHPDFVGVSFDVIGVLLLALSAVSLIWRFLFHT
jgi:hypothetical protein